MGALFVIPVSLVAVCVIGYYLFNLVWDWIYCYNEDKKYEDSKGNTIKLSDLVSFFPTTNPSHVEYDYSEIEFVYDFLIKGNKHEEDFILYEKFIFTKDWIGLDCKTGVIKITKKGKLKPELQFVSGNLYPLLEAIKDYKKYLIRNLLTEALDNSKEESDFIDLSKVIVISKQTEEEKEEVGVTKYKYKRIAFLEKVYNRKLKYKSLYFEDGAIIFPTGRDDSTVEYHFNVETDAEYLGSELYERLNSIIYSIYKHSMEIQKEEVQKALTSSKDSIQLQTGEVIIKSNRQ